MDSDSLLCNFCNKVFTSRNILLQHKNKAKYCLELQGKSQQSRFECKYCEKVLSTSQRLDTHIISCKNKKQIESVLIHQLKEKDIYISSLESTIEKLESTIEKLETKLDKFENTLLSNASKPIKNTTNNIVINNTLNLNDISKLKTFLDEKMDKSVLALGQKGLAKMLTETILKGVYKCVDPSRHNFEFTNEEGEIEKDVKAKKLTSALIKGDICGKAGDTGRQLWAKKDGSTDSFLYEVHSEKVIEVINIDRDNSKFRSELSALTS